MGLSPFVRSLVLLAALVFAGLPSARAQTAAYVISDSSTGFILEQSEGARKLPIASLTKIATAMVVLDWASQGKADLSQLATVPESAGRLTGNQGVGFRPGDRCSLRDLLYAALLQSDNVAAETLASHVGQKLGARDRVSASDTFVAQMNALARSLGMTKTRFINPHGLDHLERTVPYSTAEDLAKLTSYAMANSAFRFHVSQKERKITIVPAAAAPVEPADPEEPGFPAVPAPPPPAAAAYLLRNTNELLGIENIDGVKTGTTARAGQCLIISAAKAPETRQEGDRHIITPRRINIVILGSASRFETAQRLLPRGWALYDGWAAAGRPAKGWKAPRN